MYCYNKRSQGILSNDKVRHEKNVIRQSNKCNYITAFSAVCKTLFCPFVVMDATRGPFLGEA